MTHDEMNQLFDKGLEKAFRDLYAKAAKEGIALVTMDDEGNIVERVPEKKEISSNRHSREGRNP